MSGERRDGVALFALLFLCYTYTFPRWADWNQNSRFDLVVAIVDHGTLSIDCCVANTGDYAVFDGRTYSDKAPGLSFLAVPVYAVVAGLTSLPPVEGRLARLVDNEALRATLREGGTGLRLGKLRFAVGLTLATALVVSLPAAFAGVALYLFLRRITPRRDLRLAATLAYALGSIAFTYAGAFYAHQLVASLLLFAFCLTVRESRIRSPSELALLGFLLGLAVISEYSAVLVAAPLAGLAAWRAPRKEALLWAAVGGLLPLGLCAAYDLAVFGTPLPVGYRYSALWQDRHTKGFVSLTHPTLEALWGLTFGAYRGLFLLSPALLFAVPGFALLWRQRRLRAEVALSAWAVLAFLLFAGSSQMWWGGFAVGPRYIVPMLPFLAWPAAAVLARGPRAVRIAFAIALVASVALVWGLSWAGQQFPPEGLPFPWRDHAWPHLARADLARNAGMLLGLHGWASLLPLAAALAAVAAFWRWPAPR